MWRGGSASRLYAASGANVCFQMRQNPTNFFRAASVMTVAPLLITFVIATCSGAESGTLRAERRRIRESLVRSSSPSTSTIKRHYVCAFEIRVQCLQKRCEENNRVFVFLQWIDSSLSVGCPPGVTESFKRRIQHWHITEEGQARPDQHRPQVRIPRCQGA